MCEYHHYLTAFCVTQTGGQVRLTADTSVREAAAAALGVQDAHHSATGPRSLLAVRTAVDALLDPGESAA